MVGGKWTTFRALGETLTDKVLYMLKAPRTVSTRGLTIGGGRDYPETPGDVTVWLREKLGADDARTRLLFERYGTRAVQVWEHLQSGDDELVLDGELSTRELEWMVSDEHVVHLADVDPAPHLARLHGSCRHRRAPHGGRCAGKGGRMEHRSS